MPARPPGSAHAPRLIECTGIQETSTRESSRIPLRQHATTLRRAVPERRRRLLANAVVEQLREQRQSFSTQPPDRAGLEQIVREYLSVQHRDNPQAGCASAALLDEIGRSTDAIKRAYTEGVLVVIDDIAARLAPDDPQSARVKTLSVFALMVGTLQLSRALVDRELADAVLDHGIQNALALLLDAEHQD